MLISINLNRITPCFPGETLQLVPLESCRTRELVHRGEVPSFQTRGAITPVSTHPNSSFLPVFISFPSVFFGFFLFYLCQVHPSASPCLHVSPWTSPKQQRKQKWLQAFICAFKRMQIRKLNLKSSGWKEHPPHCKTFHL